MSSNPYSILINILTYCPEDTPKRFEIMKRALPSLAALKGGNVYFTLWDNNSCQEVKDYLSSLDFIDFKYFSKKNLYDVAPIQFLNRASKELGYSFVCHMEDDLEVFCDDPWEKLNTVLMWLKNSPQIGGSRILKWEMDNTERYNKHAMDMSKVDKANMQTHRNIITGQSLNMHAVDVISDDRKLCRLVQTNWHWYNFPVICKTEVYDSIIPREDIEPLQAQEGLMMKLYADTGLNMGAVDEGIVTHLAPPTPTSGTSVRYHMKNKFANSELKPENMGKEMPIISMEEAVLEAEVALEELRKHVNT